MQPNPLLTFFKGLAFVALAFLVGVSTCQRGNLEDKMTSLDRSVADLARQVEDLGRTIRMGGMSVGGGSTAAANPGRAALDDALDPSRPLGTPGRYPDYLAADAFPEVPAEAAGHTDGAVGIHYGPEPKGFNFVTENEGGLSSEIEEYVGRGPASRHVQDPTRWRPELCWRVEVNPDFREWTLFFRKDAVWHPAPVDLDRYPHLQGRHMVTAKDYKFTLDLILNPQTDCAPARGYFRDVESVELIDDYTVVVRWKKTLFHAIANTLGITVMPEHVYAYGEDGRRFPEATLGQSFNDHYLNRVGVVGCGPYRFVSFEPGQKVMLERFEEWYGIRDGTHYPIRRRDLLIYADPVTNLLKIKAGEVTVGALNSPQYKEEILDNRDPNSPFRNGEIEHWMGQEAAYLYFGWKNTHPLFRDRVVRTALTYACNRSEICEKIFLGRYRPMSSPVYPDGPEADPDLKPLPFDLDKAAALLDEAGWALDPATGLRKKTIDGVERTFEFALSWPGPSPDFEAALNQYKNDLLTIGVKMNPQSFEWAVYQKKLHDREFDACSLLWATNGWEHDFDQIWHSRGIEDPGSSNYIEFSNETVDRLSDELRETIDPQKRIELVREIGRTLYEEQPYCFFGWRGVFRVARSFVKNAKFEYRIRPFQRTYPMWIER